MRRRRLSDAATSQGLQSCERNNFCCFQPPSLWGFIMVATGSGSAYRGLQGWWLAVKAEDVEDGGGRAGGTGASSRGQAMGLPDGLSGEAGVT